MIDTVRLKLVCDETDLLVNSLTDPKEIVNRTTGEIKYEGKSKNLVVLVDGSKISISGSLAKHHLGSNYQTLTRETTKRAIEELSDHLLLPIEQAKVFRIDVGVNLLMDNPILEYCRLLYSAGRYHRREQKYGLLYSNSLRALAFYDKNQDLKRCRESIPKDLKGKHLLRYERRVYRRLAKQFGRKEITANLLYDENFFNELIDGWESEYFSIGKAKHLELGSVEIMKSTKQFDRTLAAHAIQIEGEGKFLAMIDDQKGELTKTHRSRMKSHIRNLASTKTLEETEQSIFELNEKVREAAELFRQ